jgi:hypothetical protein
MVFKTHTQGGKTSSTGGEFGADTTNKQDLLVGDGICVHQASKVPPAKQRAHLGANKESTAPKAKEDAASKENPHVQPLKENTAPGAIVMRPHKRATERVSKILLEQ